MCVCVCLIDAEIACSAPEQEEDKESATEGGGEKCNWKAEPKSLACLAFLMQR